MPKHLWVFEIQTDHVISAGPNDSHRKRTCQIVDFALKADRRTKFKESEKRDKYQDLARELKNNRWDVEMIIINALSTVIKGLVKGLDNLEIRGRVETIQITALF